MRYSIKLLKLLTNKILHTRPKSGKLLLFVSLIIGPSFIAVIITFSLIFPIGTQSEIEFDLRLEFGKYQQKPTDQQQSAFN